MVYRAVYIFLFIDFSKILNVLLFDVDNLILNSIHPSCICELLAMKIYKEKYINSIYF